MIEFQSNLILNYSSNQRRQKGLRDELKCKYLEDISLKEAKMANAIEPNKLRKYSGISGNLLTNYSQSSYMCANLMANCRCGNTETAFVRTLQMKSASTCRG